MSYYKDTNNKLHLLEDDAYAYLLPAGAIQITEAEADTIRAAELTNPPVAVPQSVTRFKAKAALLNAGLLDAVESLMGNETTPALARLAWKEALEFERSSQTVAAMAAALNLSGSQLDDLFIAAAQIEA